MLGRDCLVHSRHDEVQPVEDHAVRPRPRGGRQSETLSLCANAHGRIHALLDDIENYARACPYATVGEVLHNLPAHVYSGYHEMEQLIAYRGWEAYGLPFLQGRYFNAYNWWATNGSPKQDDVPHYGDLFHAARWSRKWRRVMEG